MKNNTKQAVDYIIPTKILTDGQVETAKENYLSKQWGEIDRVKDSIDVLMTQNEWDAYQSLKGIEKQNKLRVLAIDAWQNKLRELEGDVSLSSNEEDNE